MDLLWLGVFWVTSGLMTWWLVLSDLRWVWLGPDGITDPNWEVRRVQMAAQRAPRHRRVAMVMALFGPFGLASALLVCGFTGWPRQFWWW